MAASRLQLVTMGDQLDELYSFFGGLSYCTYIYKVYRVFVLASSLNYD